ncbi:hypothetical protein KBC89_00310 [Candidatus Woesebacteria bacterium]|nr:hypothetical protein [Candidatus Woesebacteria bacterium]
MTTYPIELDPFDDRFRDLERVRTVEEEKINAETDWLDVFPEAKEYIVEKAIEIGNQIADAKNSLKLCNERLALKPKKSEEETTLIITQAFLVMEINQLVQQLHLLNKEVSKHLSRNSRFLLKQSIGIFCQIDIEEARAVPIVDLFERDGRVLKRSGMNFMTLCPFHDERTPSCHLYTSDNHYYCFGCEAHGNPIDYMMNLHKKSFREAVSYLIGRWI